MTLHTGDCLEVMAGMPDASVDAVCTDPPYGLEFMGKGWDKFGATVEAQTDVKAWPNGSGVMVEGANGPFGGGGSRVRYAAGHSYQQWCEAWGREALRVTVPGGYLLAFGGTRTHHRLVCGLEDAGWLIRDELDWIYASGFPKGRANLKPAHEPIVLARKPGPLRMLAIDECRIPTDEAISLHGRTATDNGWDPRWSNEQTPQQTEGQRLGRWPSNLILTDPVFDGGVDGVVGGGESQDGTAINARRDGVTDNGVTYGYFPHQPGPDAGYGGGGGYSRFFLIPKADRVDREPVIGGSRKRVDARMGLRHGGPGEPGKGSKEGYEYHPAPRVNVHPTTKPIELMRHLVRLVTPPGGTVLDPFLGSGTTAIAAEMEGFAWIGIEKEAEYVAIAEARLNGVQKGLGLDVPAPTRKRTWIPGANEDNKPRSGYSGAGQWGQWATEMGKPEEAT